MSRMNASSLGSTSQPNVVEDVAAPEPPSLPTSQPQPIPSLPLMFAIRVNAGVGSGPLPGVNPGAMLALGLGRPPWRVELGAAGQLGQAARHPEVASVAVEADALWAGLRGCWLSQVGSVVLPVCLGAEFGTARGRGVGLADARVAHSPWGAASGGVGWRAPLGQTLFLWLEGGGVLTLIRPRFAAENLGLLYEAPLGAARAWVGVEWVLN